MHTKTFPAAIALALAMCLTLTAGCSLFDQSWSRAARAIEHSYEFDSTPQSGIVQIYTVNNKTAIQMRSLMGANVRFQGPDGKNLRFDAIGNTAVLDGVYADFTVITAGAVSQVTNRTSLAALKKTQNSPSSDATPADAGQTVQAEEEETSPEELAHLYTELLTLKERILELEKHRQNFPAQQNAAPEKTLIHSTNEDGQDQSTAEEGTQQTHHSAVESR